MTRALSFPERSLVVAVRGLLALVLLLPLVALSDVVYPFVAGKALGMRVTAALAFAAWAALALARPAWRPPRSRLLLLLALWAGVSVVAALFGASPQRSLWSYYGRMQGLFDLAHWLAFAVMAASVLRTTRDWRAMLLWNQAVGLATALQAAWAAGLPDLADGPLWAAQASGRMGNPGFLGAYLQAVALFALVFLAAALWRPIRAPEPLCGRWPRIPPPLRRATAAAFHGATLAAALWGLLLSGSNGAAAGFAAGAACAALLLALATPSRRLRIAAYTVVGSLLAGGAGIGGVAAWRFQSEAPGGGPLFGVVLLERLTNPAELAVSAGARLDNWRAGLAAFAERPLLGWGPDNYLAAAGAHLGPDSNRNLPSRGAANEGRDHAHNVLVEEAATKGVAGLAAWLALWGATAAAAVGAARRAKPGDRALVVGAAAALAGWFVQSLAWFYFPAAWLVHLLPLAFLARCEASAEVAAEVAARPEPMRGLPWPRLAAGAAALALTAGSLAANRFMHAGAAALYRAETSGTAQFMPELDASIRAFEPMATHPRILLFENVAANWAVLRSRYPDEAFRLLAWAGREEPRALAAEPRNWQLHHALAHLYREVVKTEPGYAVLAARYDASAREVAPGLDPLLPLRLTRPRRGR